MAKNHLHTLFSIQHRHGGLGKPVTLSSDYHHMCVWSVGCFQRKDCDNIRRPGAINVINHIISPFTNPTLDYSSESWVAKPAFNTTEKMIDSSWQEEQKHGNVIHTHSNTPSC